MDGNNEHLHRRLGLDGQNGLLNGRGGLLLDRRGCLLLEDRGGLFLYGRCGLLLGRACNSLHLVFWKGFDAPKGALQLLLVEALGHFAQFLQEEGARPLLLLKPKKFPIGKLLFAKFFGQMFLICEFSLAL